MGTPAIRQEVLGRYTPKEPTRPVRKFDDSAQPTGWFAEAVGADGDEHRRNVKPESDHRTNECVQKKSEPQLQCAPPLAPLLLQQAPSGVVAVRSSLHVLVIAPELLAIAPIAFHALKLFPEPPPKTTVTRSRVRFWSHITRHVNRFQEVAYVAHSP